MSWLSKATGIDIDLLDKDANIGAAITAAVTFGVTYLVTGGNVVAAGKAAGKAYLLSLGTYSLNEALAPKSELEGSNQGYLVTQRGSQLPHQIIYGKTRIAGGVVFDGLPNGTNQYLHRVIAFAGHEIEDFETIYFNDEPITINGSNLVTGPSRFNGKAYVVKKTGAPNQSAVRSSDVGNVPFPIKWDSNCKLVATAYLYVVMEYDADAYVDGIPEITAVIKGKKVYDPRSGSTAWSDNTALCLRDYLTSGKGNSDTTIYNYGLSEDIDNIDDTIVSTAANVCDHLNYPTLSGGTRFSTNGAFTTASTPYDNINNLLSSMGGMLWYAQGKWRMKPAYYTSPVLDLTEDDLRSDISVSTRHSRRDNFNVVKGSFRGPESDYQVSDFPQVPILGSSTYNDFLEVDGGQESVVDLQLPFTDNTTEARRIARIMLERNRQQVTVQASFGLRALQVQVGDIIRFTNTRFGWTNKEFEVESWNFGLVGEYDLQIDMTLKEISSSVFDEVSDGAVYESDNTELPDPTYVPPVGFATTQELREVNEQVFGVITVNLTTSDPYFRAFESEYKKTTDSDYITVGNSLSNFEILALQDGIYDVRVRGVNQLGVRGDWVNRQVELKVFAPPPQDVSNFSGNVVGNSLHLTWTPVTDLDLSHYKIRYSPVTTGATYSNAVDLIPKVARPANSVVAPAQTGTYFIKAVDKVGGLSETPTSFAVLIDSNNVENFNAIETITENPTFSGTRSDVVVLTDEEGNYLSLDTASKFDSASGNFDDALGLFDGGSGDIVSSGVYYFSNSIDLGEKYTSRVRPTFKVDYLDFVNDFDSASGNFDDREGLFDGGSDQFDKTSAKLQLRYTDDDPSGSPTWSDWQEFIVADISARAMEFRVVLTTTDPAATPIVRELSAEIDMPERTESQQDITFTGTKDITFPTAFKDTPVVGITLANVAANNRYAITSKSRTGFTIEILRNNGAQSGSSVTLDYVARGYGKELT